MTRAIARYSVVMIAIIAVVAWLLTLALTGSNASLAIGVSAAVAAAVQIGAFSLTRSMVSQNPVAAWGAGALVRLFALFAYAIVAVKVAGLPAAPALVSLFVFFFVSMLLEPVFLRR